MLCGYSVPRSQATHSSKASSGITCFSWLLKNVFSELIPQRSAYCRVGCNELMCNKREYNCCITFSNSVIVSHFSLFLDKTSASWWNLLNIASSFLIRRKAGLFADNLYAVKEIRQPRLRMRSKLLRYVILNARWLRRWSELCRPPVKRYNNLFASKNTFLYHLLNDLKCSFIWIYLSECNESALFVATYHGGHLGFFEGGLFGVSPLTWLDKALMQYIVAVLKASQPTAEESGSFNQAKKYVIAS